MFRVKICGITRVEDARLVASAGADAMGLNFFPESKRYIDLHRAEQIAKVIPSTIKKIGLFVNATADRINAIAKMIALDAVQLHGDEPPELLAELALPTIKAFRMGPGGWQTVADWLARCRILGRMPDLCLFDGFKPGEYGGTGVTLDWRELSRDRDRFVQSTLGAEPPLRFVLSGGLHSSNVAEAILAFRPFAVDTASGVESSPGKKDPTLVQAFVSAARAALCEVEREKEGTIA